MLKFRFKLLDLFFQKLIILAKSCQLLIMNAIFKNKKLKNFIHLF
jgi:hypothetical protein